MSSFFQYARQTDMEEPEETNPIFSEVKSAKKENIIPPVGIAKPELVESFLENMGDEEKILKDIADAEAYEKENLSDTVERELSSHAIRGLEGFFGGINTFLNMLTPEMVLEEESGETERFPGNKLPSANELHEFTKEKTGNYFEPKNKFTKASQETTSDIGSLFASPDRVSALMKIGTAIAGQVVKQGVKASGGSESAQDLSKLGFMTIASFANLGNAPRAASQALNEAEQMIPRGLSFSSRPTEQALQRIRNSNWYRSGHTPSKGPAMEEINRIQAQIANGRINGRMALQLRRDINEARRQLGGFQLNRPVNRRQALRYLDEVDHALSASITNYGTRVNPQFLRNYHLANEAYRITQRSRLISDVIERSAKPLQSQTAKVLFHVGGGAALAHLPAVAAATVPTLAAAKSVQIINRMIRSPVLRNHYLDVARASATGNATMIEKTIDKFDRAAKAQEKKENQKSSE